MPPRIAAFTNIPKVISSRRSIGVTNSIQQRLDLRRSGHGSEFVKKHGIHRLVHLEEHPSPEDAIRREKQLKKWNRDWKIRLIEGENPDWSDRSDLIG